MAYFIPEHINLNITCYNYYTLTQLFPKEGIQLTLAGGLLHKADQMFDLPMPRTDQKPPQPAKFFLAASGIHEHSASPVQHNYEVLTKKAARALLFPQFS